MSPPPSPLGKPISPSTIHATFKNGQAPLRSCERHYENIILEQTAPGVALLTLNRAEQYNAMTEPMFRELEQVAHELDAEDGLRVVILTGSGKGFCSGYDLAAAEELPSLGALGMLQLQEQGARALTALRSMKVPLIAAVNGPAAGGGLSLSLAADIRLASTTATFNAAFVKIGLSAGDLGLSWLLPRLIGPAKANEICFTGRHIDAEEALEIGLVNSVSEPEDLMADAVELAGSIVANSPGGVQLSKRALQANMEISSFASALELENRGQALLTRTTDMVEALDAFRQRRAPIFKGA